MRCLGIILLLALVGCEPDTISHTVVDDTARPIKIDPDGSITAAVTRVLDGDTIAIQHDGKEQIIRLDGIDCPETRGDGGQPFAKEATELTTKLCSQHDVVIVQTGKHYDRWVAFVLLANGEFLQHELLRAGLAHHARKYSDSEEMQAMEDEAKRQRVGLWSDPNPIDPEDWRAGIRQLRH